MPLQEKLFTADDLWQMPDDGKRYELHHGVLIEVAGSGRRQSQLAMWIGHLLITYIMEQKLGGAVSGADGTFVLSPFNTRIPDVAYITPTMMGQQNDPGFYLGAPDLAVEVVSPSNSPEDMQQRAGEYLGAGSRLVWIVDPEQQSIDVYRPDGQRLVLQGNDLLNGYDILPGLSLPLAKVFNAFKE